MEDTIGLRAIAAHNAVKKLLELLQRKGLITAEEAFAVLEEGADEAQDSLTEIQTESTVQG